jgi:hypothetical protein
MRRMYLIFNKTPEQNKHVIDLRIHESKDNTKVDVHRKPTYTGVVTNNVCKHCRVSSTSSAGAAPVKVNKLITSEQTGISDGN